MKIKKYIFPTLYIFACHLYQAPLGNSLFILFFPSVILMFHQTNWQCSFHLSMFLFYFFKQISLYDDVNNERKILRNYNNNTSTDTDTAQQNCIKIYIFPVLLSTKMREDNKKENPLTIAKKHTHRNWKGKYFSLGIDGWDFCFGEIEVKIKIMQESLEASIQNNIVIVIIFPWFFFPSSQSLCMLTAPTGTLIYKCLWFWFLFLFFLLIILDQQCRTLMYTQNTHTRIKK